MNQSADTAPARTPTLLRVNLGRAHARALCADLDTWRRQTGRALGFSGVLCGDYARLYLSVGDAALPQSLIALCLRYIRQLRGSMAVCGAWMAQLEVGAVLDEQALWREVA